MKFTIVQVGLVLAVLGAVPASALAQGQQQFGAPNQYVTQRSSPPNGTSIDVQYVVTGLPNANWGNAITQAAAVWNAAGANVHLVTTAAPTAITINFVSTGQPMDITVSTVVGVGTYPDGRSWNRIVPNSPPTTGTIEIHVAGGSFNDNPFVLPGPTDRDALSWLIRAFGFALGLGVAGAGDPASVMTAGNPPNGAANRTLSAGDIAALQAIYGSPEPATWALFGVGLAALGAARRRRVKA